MADAEKVKLIKNGPQSLALLDGNGHKVADFIIEENLDKALILLKKINSLRTVEGVPIYETRSYHGISTWSFHQHLLFLPALSEFIKYDEIVKFFYQTGSKYEVKMASDLSDAAGYLQVCGAKVIKSFSLWSSAKEIAEKVIINLAKVIAFLVTCMASVKLILFRPRVLVYTPDKYDSQSGSDFRVRAIYDYLRLHHIPYMEIVHTLFGREFMENLWKRKRLVMYKELFNCGYWMEKGAINKYNLSNIDEHQRSAVAALLGEVDAKAKKSVRFIRNFSRLLRWAGIGLFVSLDDMRHVQEVICACRLNGIKSYGFQHGHITKFHAGWMNYGIPSNHSATFDKLWVWNDYWKRALLQYSSCYNESNAAVGGELRRPPEIPYKARINPSAAMSELYLLIPYESLAPKEEIKMFIKKLKELGAHLFFKTRPDVPVKSQLDEYGLSAEDIEVVNKLDSIALSQIDAVVGVYTTFLYEMIFYAKPVFIMETSCALGDPLIEDGLAIKLSKDFSSDFMLDGIKNFTSKKNIAWPSAPKLQDTLKDIIKL